MANISGLGELFSSRRIDVRVGRQLLLKVALGKTSWIFYQNREDQELVEGILGSRANTTALYIPGSGVDLKRFDYAPRSIGEVDKGPRFLMYGRFIPSKGYGLYLDAVQKIKQDDHHGAEFWIMGSVDRNRKDSVKLFKRIVREDREGRITLLPWTDRVEEIIQACDIIVAPTSYNEGVPRTLLEGMASGKAVITTNWKGARDTVDAGVNGKLIEVGSLEALTKAMLEMALLPGYKLIEMGRASREKAHNLFDEEIILNAYERVSRQNCN